MHINTTRIRCIVETESSDLLLRGEISQVARDSVLAVNGHSSMTSKKFYQKRSRVRDMENTCQVHRRLVFGDEEVRIDSIDANSSVNDVSETAPVNYVSVAAPVDNIGVLHPCLHASGRRVTWSAVECSIIGKWCSQHQQQHPESVNVVSKCLRYILNDSQVRQHFHPHHVMDSTRLRWGWEKFKSESL